MGGGQAFGHVVEEGGQFGLDAGGGIGGAGAVDVLGAALLDDRQARRERVGQARQGGGHHFGQDARALRCRRAPGC